jgi:hypothetical protein
LQAWVKVEATKDLLRDNAGIVGDRDVHCSGAESTISLRILLR